MSLCVCLECDADFLQRIQTGEGSGCIVEKTTAGRKGLHMTGNGSMGTESSNSECNAFAKCLEIQVVPEK